MDLRTTNKVTDDDVKEIRSGLYEYNIPRFDALDIEDIGIFLEDEHGKKTAGLIGETFGNWLTVKYLWVSDTLRGQGIGTRLLKAAENEALRRGCKYAFLDTFSFQAPVFYQKQGYREVFSLTEYPHTGSRHYYTKVLEETEKKCKKADD